MKHTGLLASLADRIGAAVILVGVSCGALTMVAIPVIGAVVLITAM